MGKRLFSFLVVVILLFSFAACNQSEKNPDVSNNAVIPPATQISNEFAQQLPEFKFKENVIDSYDESLRYSFSVECSEREAKNYIKAVKDEGFVNGYPEQTPVSGNGYYKASNDEKYMIEIVYKNGILTVYVTRP